MPSRFPRTDSAVPGQNNAASAEGRQIFPCAKLAGQQQFSSPTKILLMSRQYELSLQSKSFLQQIKTTS